LRTRPAEKEGSNVTTETETEAEAPPVLTTEDVARKLAVTTHTVCNWIRQGVTRRGRLVKLAAFPAGKNYRVAPEALDAFLTALNGGTAPETPGRGKERERGKKAAAEWLDERLNKSRR
jgi:hypothetical protein